MPFRKFRVKPTEGAEEIIPRKIKNKVAIIEAMEEAMSDIEEEYGSDTVENYMEHGV